MELKEKFYKGDGYIFSIDGKQPITLNALSQGLQNTLGGYNGLDEKPFGRELHSTIYRRAKGINNIVAFVTEKDIGRVGYEWVTHSLMPK